MTIEEIQAALDSLTSAMLEKRIAAPLAQLVLRGVNDRPYVTLMCSSTTPDFDGEWMKCVYGDTAQEALAAAAAYIAARPTPETAAMHQYMRKLGEAVDFGVSNGIAAEYVDPVRITQKAMTENLLTSGAGHV